MSSILLDQCSEAEINRSLLGRGLGLDLGLFRCLVRSNTGNLASPLRLLYADFSTDLHPSGFYDFRVELRKRRSYPWSNLQVEFDCDFSSPFQPLPLAHEHPLFEWGLNWCVATASGVNIVIHSAVVERDGVALILPGRPGSGKSTLCAALSYSGWRLLSDELTIISRPDLLVWPVPRPISLKGTSIEVVGRNYPNAAMTSPIFETHKGSIAYAKPLRSALAARDHPVPIGFVVFPKFKFGSELVYEPIGHAVALTELMEHTFNVGLLGSSGFEALANSISGARCYAVEYGDLSSVLKWVETTCRRQ